MIWVAIAIAGALGAVARYLLDRVLSRVSSSDLPWGTIVINVTGSLLAGLIVGMVARGVVGSAVAIVVAGGFLGAYTTFSTAMYEIARLLEERASVTAIVVLVAPLVVSTGAASAGWWLGLG